MMCAAHSPGGRLLLALVLAAVGVSGVRAAGLELNASAGVDYEEAVLRPRLSPAPAGAQVKLVATDSENGVSTATVPLGRDQCSFGNMTAARPVVLDGYVTSEEGAVTNAVAHELLLMGSVHDDDWLRETPETFTNGTGTAVWSGTDFASVADGKIQIAASNESDSVACTFGQVPTPRRGFTVATTATFPTAYAAAPDPAGQRFGLTIAYLDDDHPSRENFAYVENGGWTMVDLAVCDPQASTNWQILISVDCDRQTATYCVRPSANDAWTFLGTAAQVGSASVTEATFRGVGAITGLEGNGFDAQLIDVSVEFDDDSLSPGCNLEQTAVSGRVVLRVVHEISDEKRSGAYTVRLVGQDGGTVLSTNVEFTVEGEEKTVEFSLEAGGLEVGSAYAAEVQVSNSAETTSVLQSNVMGRPLTNELWGVKGIWIWEDARTYDGDDPDYPGTGTWTGRESAWTELEWIRIHTITDDDEHPVPETVSFTPTNQLDETVSYVASFRMVFEDPADMPGPEEGVFGLTVGATDEGIRFLCLSNRTWQIVDAAIASPVLDEEYKLTMFVQKDLGRLYYYAQRGEESVVELMQVELDEDLCREFTRVDIEGVGKMTDLSGSVYSKELVRIHADFAEGTLDPGTNFEATVASGVVRFERLWETDRTNGQFRVVVRDKDGRIVGQKRVSFHDLQNCPFDYYVTGLTPGERYTVDLEADVAGVGSDDTSADGSMARIVTNAVWATDGWIREDAETFSSNKVGSGIWDIGDNLAFRTNDLISINTTEDESSRVRFQATNSLPDHTGYELRMSLFFDSACAYLPDVSGRYGCALVMTDPESQQEASVCHFAVLSNGVWTAVDTDVYTPVLGLEYDLTVRVDLKEGYGYYSIRGENDDRPYVIFRFAVPDPTEEAPAYADFRGVGRLRNYEGDGFDVTIVKASVELDESTQTPGTNFTQLAVGGIIHLEQVWLTDRDHGEFRICVRNARGETVFLGTLTYQELRDYQFRIPVEGLSPGEAYDVEVTVLQDGDTDPIGSKTVTALTSRRVGGWIHENAATFVGQETGTGLWHGTNDVSEVVETEFGYAISLGVSSSDEPVRYNPTNESVSVRKSNLREIRTDLRFDGAGWYGNEEPPAVLPNALAGATVWSESEDSTDYALAVITSNRTWCVLEDTRGTLDVTARYVVQVLIDTKAGFVRYELVTDTATNRVHQFDIDPPSSSDRAIAFSGSGRIWAVDGDAWDPNLIRSSTNEFADLNTAIVETAGEDEILEPLWWADQYVTVGRGEFRIRDTNSYLNIRFPWYYYVEIAEDDSVRIYRFNWSNNWIDYARNTADDIEWDGRLFFVKTAEGLSWIAAQATNEWVSGTIRLATNIDLTAHNWTPIAGFSGIFDGRGWAIDGLNNTNRHAGIAGGEYVGGPTNAWGRSTYGLFGTATNATLRDVTFREVAISNLADSVAALAGALAGNCAVSNVTVESGSVLGLGGTVAGLAGFADFADFLTFVNNTNRAAVAAEAKLFGAQRTAAGLLCIGGPTNAVAPYGSVVVTNNVNAGTVTNTLYDTDLFGGNIAQILAGTTHGAKYGEVHLTNNLALGTVEAALIRSPDNVIVQTNFPAVNLAAAFWGHGADGTFYRHLDANRPGAIAVDPFRHTARMLSGTFPNGSESMTGLLNDEITTRLPGATVTMTEGFDSWGPIVLDRDITFDLGGNTIFTLYVNNTFVISNGVSATVRNGEIVVGLGEDDMTMVEPFAGDTRLLNTNDNLTVTKIDETFYERTTFMVGDQLVSAFYMTDADLNAAGTVVQLFEDSIVSIDSEAGTLCVNGVARAKLSDAYAFAPVTDEKGDVIGYRVRLSANAVNMPTAVVTVGADEVSVAVGNTRAGMTYKLQRKASLVEQNWTDVGDGVPVTVDNAPVQLTTPKSGEQGYYRVLATETPATE